MQSTETIWLTVPEAAKVIKASRRSIYRAVQTGRLRAARINGRKDLRISARWLDDWIAGQATDERAEANHARRDR